MSGRLLNAILRASTRIRRRNTFRKVATSKAIRESLARAEALSLQPAVFDLRMPSGQVVKVLRDDIYQRALRGHGLRRAAHPVGVAPAAVSALRLKDRE